MDTHTEVTAARRRILYVITKANWGGAQRYVYDLATAARNHGHEVLVIAGSPGLLTERLAEDGIPVETVPSMERDVKLAAEIRSFRALFGSMRRFRPDVVHSNSSKAGLLGALAARLLGVPRIVFSAHGWAFNEKRPAWQRAAIALLHYATVLLSHATVCVSGAIRADAAWMPGVEKRLVVIHNGIAKSALLPRTHARASIAPELARSFPHALWIGTIAELHPTKGLDTLVEAFAGFVRATGIQSVLVVMGDGSEWHRLQKLVQIYDLPDRIVLAGFVPDAASRLAALDIFTLTSRSEALGYALLEAGNAGLPAIGTRVGGIPEIVKDGETGLLVPADDALALEEALSALARDPQLRERLGDALKARVASDFSVETMTARTLALYAAS